MQYGVKVRGRGQQRKHVAPGSQGTEVGQHQIPLCSQWHTRMKVHLKRLDILKSPLLLMKLQIFSGKEKLGKILKKLSYIVPAFLLIVYHKARELSYEHCLCYLLVWKKYFCWKHLCSSYWVPVRDFYGCICSWVARQFPIPLQNGCATWPACTPAAQQLSLQQAQGPQKALTGFVVPKCQQPHPEHPNPSLYLSDVRVAAMLGLCLCSSALWQWCIMLKASSGAFTTST